MKKNDKHGWEGFNQLAQSQQNNCYVFDLFKVCKMTSKFLTRLKLVNSHLKLQWVKTLQLFSVRIRF